VADGSAILELKSTTKGFLLPRMDKDQRDAMTAVAAGLQIWCTDCVPTAAMYFYTGSEWSTGGTGITSEQATAITDNSKKVGITPEQAGIITSLQAQIAELISDNTLLYPYSRVTIGTQKWMKKNLDEAAYRDGTPIPEVPRFKEDGSDNGAAWGALKTGAWCYYTSADGSNEGATYGKLYNWYAVAGIYDAASLNDSSLRKQLAPTGWHVPSDGEWSTLNTFLGQEAPTGNAGGKMKETGTAHWKSPNVDATNSSGFTGLPGGYRGSSGTFNSIGSFGFWWSSTENNTTYAWPRNLYYNDGYVYRNYTNKTIGFSVRCLRD
jgi:uncharacterized protein (TIGR02145 family)